VDTRAYLISASARFARSGGERVVLIGGGEVGRISITRNRTENGSAAVVRHPGFSTPFSGTRHLLGIKVGVGFPKPRARMSEALCRTRELLIW